jgi:hypothetical protein
MRRVVVPLTLVLLTAALAAETVPRWLDPLGREPLSYAAWTEANPERSVSDVPYGGVRLTIALTPEPPAPPYLLVLVEDRILTALDASLTAWSAEILSEGHYNGVTITPYTGGDAAYVRSLIASEYAAGHTGVVLIGAVPVPWFEMDEPDWGPNTHEEFPCDLYYMDVDGTWSDADGDGILDTHTGDITPEVWVSRLAAREMTFGHELDLYLDYLAKNLDYRDSGLGVPDRGLAYNDDDWNYYSDGLGAAYPDVTRYTDPYQTTADHLLEQYGLGFEFVHLMSHSSPWGHTFKIPGGYAGSVYNYEIEALLPEAVFVNLFSCSGTRFVEFDCIGNWYLFHPGPGLACLGSAKTGSMLNHYGFYSPLGAGDNVGGAFLSWAQANIQPGMSHYYKCWYYGLNILGDGTLHIHGGSRGSPADVYSPPAPPDGDFDAWGYVSTSEHSDIAPALLGTGDGAVCAWVSAEQGRSSVYTSLFDGGSWSAPRPLDYATYWEYGPALARSGGDYYCAFNRFDGNTYDYDLWFTASTDGEVWGTPTKIRQLNGYDLYPALEADASGRLWLVWQSWGEEGAYLNWSRYNGSSWTSPAVVSGDEAGRPSLCPDGADGVYLAYQYREADGDATIRVRLNDGSGWGSAETLDGGGGRAVNPRLFRDSTGTLWCAFEGVTDETTAVFVARNEGSGWEEAERVTPEDIAAHAPSLAQSGLGPWCVYWANDGSGRYAYVSKYNPDYDEWSGPTRLSDDDVQGWAPIIAAADSGLLVAAWHQYDGGDLDVVAGSADDSAADDYRFAATGTDDGILLSWTCGVEETYDLYRGDEPLNALPLRGSGRLSWLDRSAGGRYWLEVLRADGGMSRIGPVEAERLDGGPVTTLAAPWPCPAAGSVNVAFEAAAGPVELAVYDLAGRRVATLVDGDLTAGRHEVTWNCAEVPPGVYLCRLATGSGSLTRRLVVSR